MSSVIDEAEAENPPGIPKMVESALDRMVDLVVRRPTTCCTAAFIGGLVLGWVLKRR
jgi:hypothetical protein